MAKSTSTFTVYGVRKKTYVTATIHPVSLGPIAIQQNSTEV